MTNQSWKMISGSLAGAILIHAAMVACSSSGDANGGSGEPNANAQTTPAASCAKWQVKMIAPSAVTFTDIHETNPDGSDGGLISFPTIPQTDLEAGWEPFSGTEFGVVTARRCVQTQ